LFAGILLTLASLVNIPKDDSESAYVQAEQIIAEAKKYLGYPYHYGSTGPSSFDCSGFTGFIFKKFGYKLGRSSRDQALDGRPVKGGVKAMQKGDIVVFGSRGDRKAVGHVGIFIEPDESGEDFYFIHAEHSGVAITRWKYGYYASRFICARRILPDIKPATDDDALKMKAIADSLLSDYITAAIDSLITAPADSL